MKAAYRRLMGHPAADKQRIEGTSLDGFDAELAAGAIARLRRFAPYRDADYVALNPDVAQSDLDPASHAICYGAFEGRRFFTLPRVAQSLATIGDPAVDGTSAAPDRPGSRLGAVAVYVNSNGNAFMREIAGDLTDDLREAGVRAFLLDENSSTTDRHDTAIFVAPHEFFVLGEGRRWMRDEVIRRAFMFGTEQIQTPWCAQSLPFIFMSRGVIDMSYQAAELFRATALPATDYLPSSHRLAPGLASEDRSHALYLGLPDAVKQAADFRALSDRPIDVAFVGTESPRRNSFFDSNASAFTAPSAFCYLRSSKAGPVTLSGSDASLARLATHVLRRTKIALNIHQDEIPYFEWHRLVRQGMASGCVVVTEPTTRQRGFTPGIHYLEETASRIPDLVSWLLRSPDGRAEAERVARHALAITSDRLAARLEVGRLCGFLAEQPRPR